MSIIGGLCSTLLTAIGGVTSAVASEGVVTAVKFAAKAAAPIILSTVANEYNTKMNYTTDLNELLETKRQVAAINTSLDQYVDVVSFEIMNCVNNISYAINDLLNQLGEENVYVDKMLLMYFIDKFNVPTKYANKVLTILENNYMNENKSIRDGIKIVNGVNKKKELETTGGQLLYKQLKKGNNDPTIISDAYEQLLNQAMNSKEYKQMIV
jgi:hypothetical protein